MYRCGPPISISTLADMPGNSLCSGFLSAARTCTLRVFMSTRGSIAVILARKAQIRVGVGACLHFLADSHLAEFLLRKEEVDVDQVELLQGHDLRAGREVLTQIHRAHSRGVRRTAHAQISCPRAPAVPPPGLWCHAGWLHRYLAWLD